MSQIITWWCLYLAETLLCIFFGNTFIYEGWLFTMKNELYDAINMSVLFSRKVIDNDTVLVCRADLIPIMRKTAAGISLLSSFAAMKTLNAASCSMSPPNLTSLSVCSI